MIWRCFVLPQMTALCRKRVSILLFLKCLGFNIWLLRLRSVTRSTMNGFPCSLTIFAHFLPILPMRRQLLFPHRHARGVVFPSLKSPCYRQQNNASHFIQTILCACQLIVCLLSKGLVPLLRERSGAVPFAKMMILKFTHRARLYA